MKLRLLLSIIVILAVPFFGMGVTAPQKEDFTQKKLDRPFYGVYYGQAALPLKPDQLQLVIRLGFVADDGGSFEVAEIVTGIGSVRHFIMTDKIQEPNISTSPNMKRRKNG